MKKIKKQFLPSMLLLIMLITVINIASCDDNSLSSLCEACSTDTDCVDGLTCRSFTGGTLGSYNLCASSSTKQCKDPITPY